MNSQLLFKEKLKGKWSAAQGSEGGRGRGGTEEEEEEKVEEEELEN